MITGASVALWSGRVVLVEVVSDSPIVRKYEQQMFYFNTHRRIAKYKHEFEDYFRSRS